MTTSQLRKLSLKQLWELQERLDLVIPEKEREERSRLKASLKATAEAEGFSIDDLFGLNGKKGKRPVAPKWANPKDPEQTWSGRGRAPKWFNQKTAVLL